MTSSRMDSHDFPPVLFLLNSVGYGGSEIKFVKLANTLAARGVSVTLAYLNPPTQLLATIDSRVAVVHLQRRGKLSLRALRRLLETIRARNVRTIVAVNLYPSLYARLAQRRLAPAPPRLLVSVNTTDVMTHKAALAMPLYRRVLRHADEVIFGAQIQRRIWAERYGVGAPGLRTRVIHNGVDTEHFRPQDRAPEGHAEAPEGGTGDPRDGRTSGPASRLIIGTVGRMRPEKAQLDLVRATAALRARDLDVGALIVGEGDERPRIEAEIARLHLDRHVALAGEARDVRPFLARMDVFVLTSAVETFSNAALEAMACGIPVVSAAVGGMSESLAFGGGFTYPPGNVAALVECLAQLLHDRGRRLRTGAAARRAAVEQFSWAGMVQRFIDVLAPGWTGAGEGAPWSSDSRPVATPR